MKQPDPCDLISADPLVKEYWATVARAPESVRSRVSENNSTKSLDGKWTLRDCNGLELWRTPAAPPPVKHESKWAPTRNFQVEALQKKVAISRDLSLNNATAIVQVAEAVTSISERIAGLENALNEVSGVQSYAYALERRVTERLKALETKTTGIQTKTDRQARGIFFRGAWQPAADYEGGAIATHKGIAYVAVKALYAGGEPPPRNGSGWVPLFDAKDLPRPQLESVADEVVQVIREVVDPLKDKLAAIENEIALLKQP